MDQKTGAFLDSRLGSILTGVTINLAAGAVVLLLAKICLPEQISSWKIWLSLLISVVGVGTVIWLGVNQRMELKGVQEAQREIEELAAELRRSGADALRFRDQLESQVEGLGRRIDEVAGELGSLQKAREADLAAMRRALTDKVEGLGKRVDETNASMASSLNALEEAKLHEAAAARKLMLDQVGALGKRLDELKGAGSAPNPAVESLKSAVGKLQQELAALKKAVEGLRAAQAAPAPPIPPVLLAAAESAPAAPEPDGEQPRIIPPKAGEGQA
ncbi:MAG TPA: hypothetical protein PK280_05680 [Planctomycetota bacterium]|nr:hypothetical protein [Planctomycetota bacterium]